jgi:type IV pilus assembly protein PilB
MGVLSADVQQKIETLLLSENIVNDETLAKSRVSAAEKKESLLSYLTSENILQPEDLTRLSALASDTPYVNLSTTIVNPDMLELLPKEIAERYMAVPLGEMEASLVVAMLDADNVQAVDFLANKVGRPLKVYMASESGIRAVISQYSGNLKDGVKDVIDRQVSEGVESAKKDAAEHRDIKTIVQDSPISRALTTILEYASKNRASDIHIEPLESALKIRCRIDGVLREIMSLPKSIEPALVSRIKILANLKIDEHRVPQDGQFTVAVGQKEIDLRIAISPVIWGEQVVIRLLDKSGTSLKLEKMGYRGQALASVRDGISKPNGMVITSGPTGSGKSTSLYALLSEIKSDEINIVTLEDPVEYKMSGINQIQVNSEVGLTFASGLRSILRQDPDVVMVGEIRDKETANLAIQAALTGHLVFSTLHTNSAAGVLPRLLDMGIEPFLIASTVNTVIGQRLVRRLIDDKKPVGTHRSEVEAIHETLGKLLPKDEADRDRAARYLGYKDLPLSTDNAYTLFKGKSTEDNPSGLKGRVGLYEVFTVTDEVESLIVQRAPTSQIHQLVQDQGMITMRQDGYLKAMSGETTLSEVNRVAAIDSI